MRTEFVICQRLESCDYPPFARKSCKKRPNLAILNLSQNLQKNERSNCEFFSNVINVPSELLSPGMTAVEIERILSIEVKAQWKRRAGIDVIIMMDWESETFEASQKLKIIKDAMFK